MKKLIVLLTALTAFVFTTQAQERGSFFVGGTAGIGYSDCFEFALEPVFGYEIKDGIAVGTGLGMTVAAADVASAVVGISHCDVAADLGLLGAQYNYGDWRPAFGINGTAVGLWAVYRF